MKKLILLSLAICLMLESVRAQHAFSLQACIDTALARNIPLKQNYLLSEAANLELKQAKANVLPDLNLGFDHGINQGRSIDPFTNSYVNQSVSYAGYGANSTAVLFNGRNLRNTIRQYSYASDASRMEFQQAKDNLTLNVILAYLQALNNEDLLTSAMRQKDLSARQLERLEILDSLGAVSPSLVTDVKGQLMNDELTILNLRNALETSKLTLSQLMNIPYNASISLERIDAEEFLTAYKTRSDDIYQKALQQFALVKAVALRTKSAAYGLKAAKSALYPSLILGGGLQTNYSSVAQNAAGNITYNAQVKNNVFSTFNVGLRIPVFNAFRARNIIRQAAITVKNNELIEENTKVQLRQQIEQAHLNMTHAYDRYKTLLQQVSAYSVSFKAAEARFTAGVGTPVDYFVAKNNLDRANINLISVKYDFVLRKQILDYYQNRSQRISP